MSRAPTAARSYEHLKGRLAIMRTKLTGIKAAAAAVVALPLVVASLAGARPAAGAAPQDFDAAAAFKAKCQMCHGPKAEKSFDPAAPEPEMVEAILKGKKGEKPPFMPGYEAKGITEDQAKALAAYMKTLRQ